MGLNGMKEGVRPEQTAIAQTSHVYKDQASSIFIAFLSSLAFSVYLSHVFTFHNSIFSPLWLVCSLVLQSSKLFFCIILYPQKLEF